MVDSRIAVFPQFGQLMLPDVHHVALVLFSRERLFLSVWLRRVRWEERLWFFSLGALGLYKDSGEIKDSKAMCHSERG